MGVLGTNGTFLFGVKYNKSFLVNPLSAIFPPGSRGVPSIFSFSSDCRFRGLPLKWRGVEEESGFKKREGENGAMECLNVIMLLRLHFKIVIS